MDGQTGRELAEDGAKRAADHADRLAAGWSDMAFAHALSFMATLPDGQSFTAEQVREYAAKEGFWPAPDQRAWGAVILRLKREGRILAVGYALAKSRKSHSAPSTLWKAV